jgi:ribonucleotide monophosphatase NagD (HAD superfamily)
MVNAVKRPRTIAIDFDDTIASYAWPFKEGVYGEPKPGAAEVIQRLKDDGFRIIIWTCRGTEDEPIAKYLKKHGIPFDEINNDRERMRWQSHKPQADYYIDDRAVRYDDRDMTWMDIYKFILKRETEEVDQ